MVKSKMMGSLTTNQALLLKKLYDLSVKYPDKYYKPKDLGSFRGSAVSVNLARFKDRNWVDVCPFTKGYKISAEGISEYLLAKDIAISIDEHAVFGIGNNVGLAKAKKIFAKAA